ncbi:MAG: DUF5696 domain-containing protein [Oscillospiraceae bacterium]|nr:DUF5696 domain-containing protein [Oscillospiraceae bacterium]
MSSYILTGKSYKVLYSPENLNLQVQIGDKTWEWNKKILIKFTNGIIGNFSSAECSSEEFKTGVSTGVKAVYKNFAGSDIIVRTSVSINKTDDTLSFELYTENEAFCETEKIYWPGAFNFDVPEKQGYTILPFMQGVMIPSRWDKNIIQYADGKLSDRDAYMCFYGQVDNGYGYCAIFDTQYDAGYNSEHVICGETLIRPYWRTSMGRINYKRIMKYTFISNGDYNDLCKIYRKYLIETGKFVTLKEKIARNPNVAKLIGTPIVHDMIAIHISPDSQYYDKENPAKNDYYKTFDSRAELLRKLKMNGVDRAYLHYDGWGVKGYDNCHPDAFPVFEAAGGSEGMKMLSDTARELGYIFGIHDQYMDYYYDGENFSLDNATKNADGTYPYMSVWYGGKQSTLCADVARDYVKRNYTTFKELGIVIEGAYFDEFSVVEMQECFDENHRMTREQCAEYRRECFDYLTSQGIIPSSEEVTDTILPSIALCHNAPFAIMNVEGKSEPVGVLLPLFNLVYHECVIVPWVGLDGRLGYAMAGWAFAGNDSPFLWGLLCGGTIYYSAAETPELIEKGKIALQLHEKVALSEMVSHEFIDGNYRRHRAVYADGSTVEINLDTQEFNINLGGE